MVLSATSGAERSPHWSTRFSTSNWSIAEGLPQSTVTDIAQDERGFLWITTLGGVVRFDGRTFKRVAPSGTEFGSLRFTAVTCLGSTVWVGTEHGRLFRIDDWGKATPVEVPLESGNDPIWELETSASTLLVAAGRFGAYAVDDREVRRLTRGHVDHVEVASGGTIWLLGSGGLECTGPGCAPGTHHAVEDGHSLWFSREGRPRVIDQDGGVLEVRAGKLEQLSAGAPDRIFKVDSPRAREWIAKGDEVSVETPAGVEQVLLSHPLRRSQPGGEWRVAIRRLFVDAQGTLWVATNNAGLFRVRDRHLSQVGVADGMVGESASLVLPLSTGGALLSTYCHGLQRFADGHVSPIPVPNESGCVWALAEFDGAAWLGLTGELYRFEPLSGALQRVFQEPDADPKNLEEFKAILGDPSGDVWLGTTGGLWRLGREGKELKLRQLWRVAEGLPHDTVTALAFDRNGDLLVGTLRGAVRLHAGTVERLIAPQDDHPAAVRDFWVEERGVTWLATYGEGLARLEARSDGPQAARWFGTGAGLPSEELSRILPVDDEVWLNTNRGVLLVERAQLEAFAQGKARLDLRILDSGEGNGGGQTAGGRLSTGQLIFPTVTGLAIIDPEEVRGSRPPIPLFIEETQFNQLERDFIVHLATPHDPWSDEVRVERSLFKDGELEHRDVGALEATYLDLHPGQYVFIARRLNSAGVPGPAAEVPFTVEPALTERPLVRLIISFILGLAGLGWVRVLRSRANALQAQLLEHERAETARRERDAVYQTVFDGSPGPLFLLGREGALEKLNPAARRLLGLSEPKPGDTLTSFLEPSEREAFREMLVDARQVTRAAEHTVITQGGERRLVRLALGPLTLGGVPHTLVAATDVTAEREAARQRDALLTRTANAQRLEGLGRLAAGVAHDFNNVLAVLQLELEELRRVGSDPKSLPLITEMQEAIDSGKSLTSRFLVFGRDEGEAPSGRLDEAVAHARSLLGRLLKPDVELVIDCQAPGAAIRLAPAHLDQLLLNLVVNAQDAVGAKGKVIVRTRRGAQPREEVVVLPPPAGELVELSVEDSGHGMDAATLARAFEPFFTTKDSASGTGMGLAVVHGIATRAGAGLSVRTRVQGGSTFSLQFPIAQAGSVDSVSAPRKNGVATPSALTVLICEDAAPLRKAMGRLFTSAGFSVLEAPDGQQALALVEQRQVHLVITDLVMPVLDGAGLIAALRRQGRAMPILLLSGYPSNALSQLDETARAGVVMMQKPVEPSLLIEAARKIVAQSS